MATLEHTIGGHASDINAVNFNESMLASCSSDRTVRLWSITDFTELPSSPLVAHTYPVHHCVFSPNGAILASCSTDGKCILWDVHTGEEITHLSHPSGSSLRTCKFSPNGELLATGCDDNKIGIWHVASRKLLKLLVGQEASAVALAFTPDGAFLVTGSIEGHLFFWDAMFAHGKVIKWENDAHDLGVTCCEFSPTFGSAGHAAPANNEPSHFLLATSGFDNLLKLWNFSGTVGSTMLSVSLRCTLEGHGEPVLCCRFSPDGAHIISGSNDHTLRIWDTHTGVELANINAHTRYVTSCAFSRNGKLIASGSNDKMIKIWRLDSDHSGKPQDVDLIKFDTPTSETTTKPPVARTPSAPKSAHPGPKPPETWDVNDVCEFLAEIGLSQYAENFRGNAIDGVELLTLNHDSLQNALHIEALGHRNKILRAIEHIEKHPLKQRHTSVSRDEQVPEEFYCPITMEIMRDPVIACDGYTYERAAISSWIANGKTRSPMTNAVLANHQLTPNRSLKIIIQKHLQLQQQQQQPT